MAQIANLESSFEHLEDAVAIINPKGEVLFANAAAQHLLPGIEVGRSLDALLPADHALRRLVRGDAGQPPVARADSRVVRRRARESRASG